MCPSTHKEGVVLPRFFILRSVSNIAFFLQISCIHRLCICMAICTETIIHLVSLFLSNLPHFNEAKPLVFENNKGICNLLCDPQQSSHHCGIFRLKQISECQSCFKLSNGIYRKCYRNYFENAMMSLKND